MPAADSVSCFSEDVDVSFNKRSMERVAPREQEDRSIGLRKKLLVELKQHTDSFIRPNCTLDAP